MRFNYSHVVYQQNKMLSRVYLLLSVLAVLGFGLCAAEKLRFPAITCKRSATNYTTCLKDATNKAWPIFAEGLPEFDFPSFNPYFYKYEENEINTGELRGKISVTNSTLIGFTAMRFKSIRPYFSDDAFRLEIRVHFPKVFIYGDCEAHGNVGGFRMGGKGTYNMTLGGIRAMWDLSGPVKNDTWTVEHFRIFPTIKTFNINVEDVFGGNREINNLAVAFVNEYWPSLYRIVIPIAAQYWDTFFCDMVNHLFSKVSFSETFPE